MTTLVRSCAQQLTEAIERLEGKTFDSWARFGIDDPSPLEPEWWADRVKPLLVNQDRNDRLQAAIEAIREVASKADFSPYPLTAAPAVRRILDLADAALKGKQSQ